MVWNQADVNCGPPSVLTFSGMPYAWNNDLNVEISFFAELWCSLNWHIWIHWLIQSAIDKYKWQFCWKKSAQICWNGHPRGNDRVRGSFEVSGDISLKLWQMYLVFYIDAFMSGQYTNTLAQAIMLVTPWWAEWRIWRICFWREEMR